jgi:hypothetical protein
VVGELPVAAPVALTEATNEVLSAQANRTETSVLFHPFKLAAVSRVAVKLGAIVSIFTSTGMVVEPVKAPVLLALSVAWQEMLCVPSPETLKEPLATWVPIPVGLPTGSEFTPSVQVIALTLLSPVVVSSAVTVAETGECTYQLLSPSGGAVKEIVTTGGLVSGLNTVSAAPVVVLLFACTLSVAVKLPLMVWTANGVVGVTVT